MKKQFLIFSLFCCALLCASPYGRALKQAKKVAGHGQHGRQTDVSGQIFSQLDGVIKKNRGVLPGPSGVAGLKKISGPGKISPDLLKKNSFAGLSESNCAWAYTGSELGKLSALPRGGMFPVIFTKPAPGIQEIKIRFADGSTGKLDARRVRSSSDVVKMLQQSSPRGKHKVWQQLFRAAAHIDRTR